MSAWYGHGVAGRRTREQKYNGVAMLQVYSEPGVLLMMHLSLVRFIPMSEIITYSVT